MEKLLKVCETHQNNKRTCKINLAGDWLKNYGFLIGDFVKVTVTKNEIVISKNDSTELLSAFNVRNPQLLKLIENIDLTL